MKQTKILIIGDIHSDFGRLNYIINKERPDVTIQCGDNAYFWGGKQEKDIIKSCKPVYLIPGNHEDWNLVEATVGRYEIHPSEVEKNIDYCPIGSHIVINNKKILFVGGADSTDKSTRIFGITWFEQELLSQKDLDYILNSNNYADIIVSHTCPISFQMGDLERYDKRDPSRQVLDILLHKYNPYFWFFSHWHTNLKGNYHQTKWECLNKTPETKCYAILNL